MGPLAGATLTDDSQLIMTTQKKINPASAFQSIEKVRPTMYGSLATTSP
jgi:hypothetical protein